MSHRITDDDVRRAAERAGVRLRPARTDDLDAFDALMGDPGVVHGTMQVPYTAVEQRRDWFTQALADRATRFVIAESLASSELVGNVGVTQVPLGRRRHTASLGMSVRDAHQGRGVGTALLAAAVQLADDWLQVHRLELEVYCDNEPAVALYRRFGFEIEGTMRDYSYRDGAYIDAYSMARLRPPA